MIRFILLATVVLSAMPMAAEATAPTAFSNGTSLQQGYLLAKGQESMGSKELNDSFIDMTHSKDSDRKANQGNATGRQAQRKDTPPDKKNAVRKPTKWREDSNIKSYINNNTSHSDNSK